MMLMLSKTGLGSWAHMNLHESKSPEERREDSGIAALPEVGGGGSRDEQAPSSLPLASLSEARQGTLGSFAPVLSFQGWPASCTYCLKWLNPTSRLN